MADIKGIELASDIYGLEDETARNEASENTTSIGDLSELETTEKTDLVSALNEVANKAPPVVLTCGYYQLSLIERQGDSLSAAQMSTLIGKQLSALTVGQGVLLQGFTKRGNETDYLPFSIFIRKTESGYSPQIAVADQTLRVDVSSSSGEVEFVNSQASMITLSLNVVGINASIIYN